MDLTAAEGAGRAGLVVARAVAVTTVAACMAASAAEAQVGEVVWAALAVAAWAVRLVEAKWAALAQVAALAAVRPFAKATCLPSHFDFA